MYNKKNIMLYKKTNSDPSFDDYNRRKVWNIKQLNASKKILQNENNYLLMSLDLPKDVKYRDEERTFIRYFDITRFGMNADENIHKLWFHSELRNNYINCCLDSFIHRNKPIN